VLLQDLAHLARRDERDRGRLGESLNAPFALIPLSFTELRDVVFREVGEPNEGERKRGADVLLESLLHAREIFGHEVALQGVFVGMVPTTPLPRPCGECAYASVEVGTLENDHSRARRVTSFSFAGGEQLCHLFGG
jgi:hypothetical protein